VAVLQDPVVDPVVPGIGQARKHLPEQLELIARIDL
jgi:hypothetical protein